MTLIASKKRFIEYLQAQLEEDDFIVSTQEIDGQLSANSKKKTKRVPFVFSANAFARSGDIGHIAFGKTPVLALIICKKEDLSAEAIDKIERVEAPTGEQAKNPLTNELKVTDRQLSIIREACELLDRLLMGQIESELWSLFAVTRPHEIDHDEFSALCRGLKKLIFPEHADNQYYGVGWREDDNRQQKSQIAYEIEMMIRHVLWKRNPDRTPGLTCSSPPLHYSTESLIELEKIEINDICPKRSGDGTDEFTDENDSQTKAA